MSLAVETDGAPDSSGDALEQPSFETRAKGGVDMSEPQIFERKPKSSDLAFFSISSIR